MFRRDRLNVLLIGFTIFFVVFVGRLAFLQLIQNEDLSQQAASQRALDTTLKVVRGNIYDRNMIPFTNNQDRIYAVVIPNLVQSVEQTSKTLAELTGYTPQEIIQALRRHKPITYIIDDYSEKDIDTELEQPGIKIIRLSKRYGDNALARHVIGYINNTDAVGYAGIEKVFNEELTVNKFQSIGMVGDAVKRSIPGLGYRVTNCFNENNLLGVQLTLNYHIQKIVEDIMDETMESGAVIVTDIDSGDILALASRPNYSQDNIEQYVDGAGSELLNKAFSAYDLGSVFKIIVTASALEEGVVSSETLFRCTGSIEVDGKNFHCSTHQDGEQEIDFLHAFASSCNSTFIDVGLKVGYKPIVDMAKRFGFGTSLELLGDLYEQNGYIPNNRYVSARETANISIGQGEILVTPIQVVDMITTIANNGVRKRLNVVNAVITDIGNVVRTIRHTDNTRIISGDVAQKIRTMMAEVTVSGTGKRANLDEYGGIAGKTGSAETGWMVEGKTKVHAWFAGYYPIENPKYAMVVFVEDGKWGGSTAAPIFRKIAEEIMRLNYK